ncbi:hypothetical protein O3P69_012686 [Scylla paramamosain]|uniref:Uncharacterized protein n=1 Tax=Scylla paramamosain TaxID=85552 RepID=A0AAW0SDT6_SCYPA
MEISTALFSWLHIFSTQSEGSVIPPVHYPNFYSQHYHNNERSGVVAEDSFEEDNASASSEQEALECNSHRWQGNTAYLPSHNSDALNELGQDN